MLSSRLLSLLVVIAIGGSIGCGAGGGGGSKSSVSASSSGGGGSNGTGGAAYAGPSTGTATATIAYPARGTFISGSPQITLSGTASAPPSGVASVSVNGQRATLSGNAWSVPWTLAFGVNTFAATITDNGGAITYFAWSVVYSPTYLDPARVVPNAGEVRLSENAVQRIVPAAVTAMTQGGALQTAIQGAAGASSNGLTINSITFGTPSASARLVPGGIDATIDIPNLAVNVSYNFLGANIAVGITATNAHIDATVDVTLVNGAFVVTVVGTPQVSFTNFNASLLPQVIEPLVIQAIQGAIKNQLPPPVTSALNGLIQPRVFSVGSATVTLTTVPTQLAITTSDLLASGDVNVAVSVTTTATLPTGPGSPARNGATTAAPTLLSSHDVSLTGREDLLNRILYAAWTSGGAHVRIDQAFLSKHGVSFPIPLEVQSLLAFFPALASLNPHAPIAFDIDPQLPPVAEVTGAPDLLTAGFGELHMNLEVDSGAGFVSILGMIVQLRAGASVAFTNNQVQVSLGQPSIFDVDMVQNQSGLAAADVARLIQTVMPTVVGLAATQIPAVTLPALPGGLQLRSLDARQDGPGADFLTIDGDL